MPKVLDYNATLVERQDLTPALAIFTLRCDEPFDDFVPGQYMTIGMNNEEVAELGSVRRPMSLASAPQDEGGREFYIRFVDHPESDNPLTHLLWRTKVGDRLYIRPKAVGHFTVPHTVGADDPRVRVTVAAGTGLAPFISMVRHEIRQDPEVSLARWAILHGASYPADLGYREELEGLAQRNGLVYAATVSRPKEAPDWQGDVGRVEDYFRADRLPELEGRLGLEVGGLVPENAVIYICGLQGTIGQTLTRMIGRGFVPDNKRIRRVLEVPDDAPASLFFEQYDKTPVIPIDDEAEMVRLRAELHAAIR
ncbi:MAG: FAD-binding oxidoreductase [Acidobacteriota bacterium]